MNAIRNLFAAFANLASSVNALASVVDVATGKLRQQLALDAPEVEVIDHRPPGEAEDAAPRRKSKRTAA